MVRLSNSSLSDFIKQIVSSYRNVCESERVSLTLDIEDVSVPYEPKMVRRAVELMMENAIDSMPEGGEVEATLINAEYQWELEIADSGRRSHTEQVTNETSQRLPKVVCEPANRPMNSLQQLSILMNATIQSWNCPLGGTAIVLVVPKGHANERTISKAA